MTFAFQVQSKKKEVLQADLHILVFPMQTHRQQNYKYIDSIIKYSLKFYYSQQQQQQLVKAEGKNGNSVPYIISVKIVRLRFLQRISLCYSSKKHNYNLNLQTSQITPVHLSSYLVSLANMLKEQAFYPLILEVQIIIPKNRKGGRQMKIFKKLKKVIEMNDFFNSAQMLRYQNESEYRTFTGGIISLGIIVTIIIAFANMILDTLNLTSFTYTQNVITKTDPSATTINTAPSANFMFGVEIWHHNLSGPVRYFDLVATFTSQDPDNINTAVIDLVECTHEHWSSIPEVTRNYDKLEVGNWLCPHIGDSFQIVGKFTSDYYKQLMFTVAPCNNGTDPNRPCATPAQIEQLFAENSDMFYFTFYYVNTIINPDQSQYKSYYLEDSAYAIFGKELGIQSYLQFSDVSIQTDNSIWPFPSILKDDGFMSLSLPSSHPYAITASNHANYVSMGVQKASTSIVYVREVQKISAIFSFIGGLIGALMAGLFIIHSYTSFAYEITVAIQVFKVQQKQEQSQHQNKEGDRKGYCFVNFMKFILYYTYWIIKFFKEDYKDDKIEYLNDCRKQILKQLDVKWLIKRIIFLEYSMTFILSDYQLEGLQLHRPTHPLDVRQIRRRVDNADKHELESSSTYSFEERKDDVFQPQVKFNLGSIVPSNKVANINGQDTLKIIFKTTNPSLEQQRDVMIENISDISLQDAENKQRSTKQARRSTLIRALQDSAKKGDQLSQRIWDSIKKIEGSQDSPF